MKNTKNIDVIEVIGLINRIVKKKTNEIGLDLIIQDLKMSKFKIRAIDAELDQILKKESSFLMALWKIDKIDSIVNRYINLLAREDKKLLLQYLDDLESATINDVHSHTSTANTIDKNLFKLVKLEVFKDRNKIN